MDWNRVEGNWKTLKGNVKEHWGKLTDDDLNVIEGRREQLGVRRPDHHAPEVGPPCRGGRCECRPAGRAHLDRIIPSFCRMHLPSAPTSCTIKPSYQSPSANAPTRQSRSMQTPGPEPLQCDHGLRRQGYRKILA